MGYNYIYIDKKKSLQYINDAKNLSKKINFNDGLASSYINMGNNYYINSDLDLAFQNYKKAKSLKPTKKVLGEIYLGFGLYYFSKNYFDEALLNFNKALSIFESTNQKRYIVSALNNIANIYKETKNYEKAIYLYKKGLKLNKEINSTKNDEIRLINIASCYFLLDDFDTSLRYLQIALKTKNLNDSNKALIYGNIGNSYINKLQYYEGQKYVEKAIALNISLEDDYGLSKNYIHLGYLNLEKSKTELGFKKKSSLIDAKKYIGTSISLEKK